MSYYSDHDKYGDFFNSYSPTRSLPPKRRPPKKRKRRLRPWVKLITAMIALILAAVLIASSISRCSGDDTKATASITSSEVGVESTESTSSTPERYGLPTANDLTATLGSQIESQNAILIDAESNTVLARRNADKRIYPASMTKVMTLLTVAENIDSIDGTFKMTSAIIDPLYLDGLTLAGFAPNEEVKIIDMIYGMVLESGAEASVGLAVYVAESEESFVALMNKRVKELGLNSTHFTNVSGRHDTDHYTTCTEMAVILKAAIDNDFCREVLSTEYYTVAANDKHEELTFHSGMFSKMYGTEPENATVKGGKTGFTSQSLFCLASFAESVDGRTLICVTAQGAQKYSPIYDCITLYKDYSQVKK